jgi:hypothetical protein
LVFQGFSGRTFSDAATGTARINNKISTQQMAKVTACSLPAAIQG